MNAIEMRDVCKRFKGFELDHVNLTLPSGCIMGLVGENGAGKSTLIKLLMGAIFRDSGEIKVLGQENSRRFEKVKEDIGVVLSEANFPEGMTARQIQKMMRRIYRNWDEAVYEGYISRFQLPENKQFKTFSKGMKMKLAIAVALSHHAKLLVLDEATVGLDPVVRDEILDIFFEFTREEDHSILISSHITSDLERLCDYICFIHQGRVLICEEKDRLRDAYGIWPCTQEQLDAVDTRAVLGVRKGAYGHTALVKRSLMANDRELRAPSLEEILIYIARGVNQR